MEKEVALVSLNDPVDTSTPQGRLCFSLFSALAEFERSIIRERTMMGLTSARLQGRHGGRPKGLPENAVKVACAAESLYREGRLTVDEIADQLGICKSTLYSYLRHRRKPSIEIRQIKYLNNLVEQDHRGIKRRVRPMLGFQSFKTARRALKGIELCHMIRKGQYDKTESANDWEYFYSLAA